MIVKEREMQSITFQSKSLKVVESIEHTFLMATKDVASGYGVTEKTIRDHKLRQSDELIEGKHFIIDYSYNNTPKTYWTKRGIVRLGFFIKSQKAKAFRDWAEDYVIDGQNSDNELKQIILQQNEQIAQLIQELGKRPKRLPDQPTDENLKRVLIRVHDGYHRILTTCSPLDMIDELRKMTNMFQIIGSINHNGNNLNTDTVAGHLYWHR